MSGYHGPVEFASIATRCEADGQQSPVASESVIEPATHLDVFMQELPMPLVIRPASADELAPAEQLVVRTINDLTVRYGFGRIEAHRVFRRPQVLRE